MELLNPDGEIMEAVNKHLKEMFETVPPGGNPPSLFGWGAQGYARSCSQDVLTSVRGPEIMARALAGGIQTECRPCANLDVAIQLTKKKDGTNLATGHARCKRYLTSCMATYPGGPLGSDIPSLADGSEIGGW
jgi:hypothetical protein